MKLIHALLVSTALLFNVVSYAQDTTKDTPSTAVLVCMSNQLKNANSDTTIAELRKQCEKESLSALAQRGHYEQQVNDNPFAILPHKPN